MPSSGTALIIVDVQNDFITGSLALSKCAGGEDGAEVVPAINRLLLLQKSTNKAFDLVVYTMDWHPVDHVSFGEWPAHCVADTWGAQLHGDLKQPSDMDNDTTTLVHRKGTDRAVDSYSAFWDNDHRHESPLRAQLQSANIDHVLVCGLALDFCVYYTARDAAEAGFQTTILEDCCRAIEPESSPTRLEQRRTLTELGVKFTTSDQL